MIPVDVYSNLWQFIASRVNGIDQTLVVHEESDLALTIRDMAGGTVLLMAILPSTDAQSEGFDNYHETDSCFVFVVKKSDRGSLLWQEFLDEIGQLQKIIAAVKKQLLILGADTDHTTEYSHLLHGLIIPSMHTDPEYNLLGCNGWGLSFKIKTNGFLYSP